MEIKKLIKKFCIHLNKLFCFVIDLNKIVVSSKWKLNDTTYKYFCRYLNNDVIQPLCVILPQMSGYIKYLDDGEKNMSFVTNDEEVYETYDEIWNVVKKTFKVKIYC